MSSDRQLLVTGSFPLRHNRGKLPFGFDINVVPAPTKLVKVIAT